MAATVTGDASRSGNRNGTLNAAAHCERVAHLILLTPGLRAVGVEETDGAVAGEAGAPAG